MAGSTTIRPIIGMEIHVQLATRTKLFCGCAVEFGAEPNSRVCPVCLGLPGALPVLNRRAYELSLRAGVALDCEIARFTKWDRKSYYYPDMPKNYQISQYDLPLSSDGRFEIPMPDGSLRAIGIIRAHLEEDAGKSLHAGSGSTRVDLNRAGTPLLEIVTQPDLRDADEAATFCIELRRLVRYLGVSDADMQKGHMRFEPNVNVAITHDGQEYRTPIAEVKNLNSFRSVRGAIQFEIDRQVVAWQADHDYTLDKLGKMNFGWNDDRGVTEFQRAKEESHDYRYFPDPDLTPVAPDEAWIERVRSEVGELPVARQRRFRAAYGMSDKACEVILADGGTGDLYDASVAAGGAPATLTKQFVGVWSRLGSERNATVGGLGVSAERVAELAGLVADGTISAAAAGTVAGLMVDAAQENVAGGDERVAQGAAEGDAERSVLDIAREAGVIQERDSSTLKAWVDEAFSANPKAIEDAKTNPKKAKAAAGFLRGQVMRISGGKADPKLAGEMIESMLGGLRSDE